MKIKIHSSELNRMMKTVVQCIDPKDQNRGNIEVIYDNNLLTIRGAGGHFSAVMSTPVLGGDGETFCVDGTMFARVCSMCSGEIEISTDGKTCTVKGAGRTRLPIVNAKIPAFDSVSGKACTIRAEKLSTGYNSVSFAISSDQGRLILTGILMESCEKGVRMVTLDGFRMAIETVEAEADDLKIVVPGTFMKLVCAGSSAGETVTFRTNGKRLMASTDGMMLSCALLTGDYPDYRKILPENFKTESLVYADQLLSALKSGSVINQSNNLVKLDVGEKAITVKSNSEQADFDANVGCETNGTELAIAFNHKYLMETIGSIVGNQITMKFNSPINPCVISGQDTDGLRLILPVRVAG